MSNGMLKTTVDENIDTIDQIFESAIAAVQEQQQEHPRLIGLGKEHAREMARLHIEGISTGFISSLGLDFVTALYEGIVESRQSFGVVTDDERLIGFVAFSTNVGKLYKSIILKKGLRFGFLLARKMFSFQNVKKAIETLLYPNKVKKLALPSAELLSIVVAPEARGFGWATELVARGFEECRRVGIDEVKVLVAAANEPANKLYRKCSFELVEQTASHGIPSNIYVARIAETKQVSEPELVEEYWGLKFMGYAAERLKPAAAAVIIALAHLFRNTS